MQGRIRASWLRAARRLEPWGWALLIGVPLFAGCVVSNTGDSSLASDLLDQSTRTDVPRTDGEVRAYPYAQMAVRVDGGRAGIAVLAEYQEGNHLWVSADDEALTIDPAGQVRSLQLGGLRFAEQKVEPIDADSRFKRERRTIAVSGHRSPHTDVDRLQAACSRSGPTAASILVLGEVIDVEVFNWTCEFSDLGETIGQTIWLDDEGRVRRFDGRLWPSGPRLRLDVLKVPA